MPARPARVPASSRISDPPATLDLSPTGRPVLVLDVDAGVAAELAREGIYPGARVTVAAHAPLGGPTIVAAGGARIAVSRDVARSVVVRGVARDGEAPS